MLKIFRALTIAVIAFTAIGLTVFNQASAGAGEKPCTSIIA